ncbi:hypothetical protein EMPS_09068 [Entomortierella parvispora]|uniref:Uncharacterized protein n=1 Tax=Entomortierella parvispora TaxID=205924 RepID=A0A9P3HH98_9FUNG|nr:hypothetical protein EMPS_09068 [Entomortierella parvispora]
MTEFSQRFRGSSLPKLNLLPASHFLQQQQQQQQASQQQQHPFDSSDKDLEMDMSLTFESSPLVDQQPQSKTFVSAHPSPEVSDESDSEQVPAAHENPSRSSQRSNLDQPPLPQDLGKRRLAEHHREQIQNERSLSQHILLAPIPVPKSTRTPPHSPLHASGSHRASFSSTMHTPPGSASTVPSMPCSDPVAVEALIRREVHPNMASHTTDKAHFWPLGKLSEFSFSDRFVRSRIFEFKESQSQPQQSATVVPSGHKGVDNEDYHMVSSLPVTNTNATDPATEAAAAIIVANTRQGAAPRPPSMHNGSYSSSAGIGAHAAAPGSSSWRLRLYPHGRGDRHRDSEYIGLYLQQEGGANAAINRRGSVAIDFSTLSSDNGSLPSPMRGSFSSRRSISGSSGLPVVRRHVTLFLATENGDCLAKQDLVQWFSGYEGGLGFPRMVSRKAVQDAVRALRSVDDDDEEEYEVGIVAGVIFHDL